MMECAKFHSRVKIIIKTCRYCKRKKMRRIFFFFFAFKLFTQLPKTIWESSMREEKMRSLWNLNFAAITHQTQRKESMRKWIAIDFQQGRGDGIAQNKEKIRRDNLLDILSFLTEFLRWQWKNRKRKIKKKEEEWKKRNGWKIKEDSSSLSHSARFICFKSGIWKKNWLAWLADQGLSQIHIRIYVTTSNKAIKQSHIRLHLNGSVHVSYKFKFLILCGQPMSVCIFDQANTHIHIRTRSVFVLNGFQYDRDIGKIHYIHKFVCLCSSSIFFLLHFFETMEKRHACFISHTLSLFIFIYFIIISLLFNYVILWWLLLLNISFFYASFLSLLLLLSNKSCSCHIRPIDWMAVRSCSLIDLNQLCVNELWCVLLSG